MGRLPGDCETLLNTHWREVYAMLLALTRNAVAAEDLTQDVFLLAHKKGVSAGPQMSAWLKETGRWLLLNHIRRKRSLPMDPADISASLPDRNSEQESGGAEFSDKVEALRRCMEALAESDRKVLAARYELNTPLASIAQDAGQSEGYIKQRLLRLRTRLSECIGRRLRTGGADV